MPGFAARAGFGAVQPWPATAKNRSPKGGRPSALPYPGPRPPDPCNKVAMRKKGRTFSYIAEEIGIGRDVIRRELRAHGISTAPVKADRRARQGRGFWRCFD